MVEKIILLNEYFSDALTIKAYNSSNPNILKGLFPTDEFEYAIAIVRNLGIIEFADDDDNKIKFIKRMTYPASPGKKVYLVEPDILRAFIGLDYEAGLNIGNLKIANIQAKINIDRLFNKHLSILSISGGGKILFPDNIPMKKAPDVECPAINNRPAVCRACVWQEGGPGSHCIDIARKARKNNGRLSVWQTKSNRRKGAG